MEYLDFELPLKELEDQLDKCNVIGDESKVDVRDTCKKLKLKIEKTKKEIYSNITPWQRVQLSRHPSRPYTLDYINALTDGNFLELHGDRNISDDKAMVGGLGKIDNQSFMFIGQQKGNNIKTRQYRNFGMANPEGYRKALRLMKLAEKFSIPIVTFIDTPGAYPGIEAEEKGQAEAIARNLYEMFNLKTQIICIVIGEGASGGALGIGIGDKIMMLENTWYSVISPEGCASILFRDPSMASSAADSMKVTANDLLEIGIADEILKEPDGAAHISHDKMCDILKETIIRTYNNLKKYDLEEMIKLRNEKYDKIGYYEQR